jgi:hypothetical protein
VPIDGYGCSNDAQGFLSAPSFDAVAITLPNADDHIDTSISLIYPRAPSSANKKEFDEFIGLRKLQTVIDDPAPAPRLGTSQGNRARRPV